MAGFVGKDQELDRIATALDAIAARRPPPRARPLPATGGRPLPAADARALPGPGREPSRGEDPLATLTPRETEVLRRITAGARRQSGVHGERIPEWIAVSRRITSRSCVRGWNSSASTQAADPRIRDLKRGARLTLTTWILIVLPLLLAELTFVILNAPAMLRTTSQSLGEQARALAAAFAHGDIPAGVVGVISAALLVLPVAGLSYILLALGKKGVLAALAACRRPPPAARRPPPAATS